jgi:tetratricopeptide (TPR) repeat protein
LNRTSAAKVSRQHQAEAQAYVQNARILAENTSAHLEGEQNLSRVIELLEKAVTLDPGFSEAHAELALAYSLRVYLYAPEEKNVQERALLSVERALSLNSNLAKAYLARGRLQWTPSHHFAAAKALDDITHALELDPTLSEAYQIRGQIFLHVGLLEEGMHEFEKAISLNPANNAAHFRIGEAYVFGCEFQKALDKFETIDVDFIPDFRITQICLALIGLGRKEEARKYLDAHPTDSGGLIASTRAMVHALFEQEREAEDAIRRAAAKRGFGHFHHTAYQIACAYALMDNKDGAIEYLSKAAAAGLKCYPLFERDPNLANLRSDPRFIDFLAVEKKSYDSFKAKYGIKNPPSHPRNGRAAK